jgi:phosphoribosyl 1,2-cyclic phosphate phosphodiesterase
MIHDVEFIPIQVLHEKLPVTGFRIGDFTYITDASYIAPEEIEKIRGSRVIVLNALRNSKHVSHFSVGEAVDILTALQPEAAFLTHLSHFVGLHEDVNRKLPDFIQLAYDGLTITI